MLNVIQIPHANEAITRGKDVPKHARRHSAVSSVKMAEPIDLSYGLWTWPKEAQVQLYLPGDSSVPYMRAHSRYLANTIQPSVCGGDATWCQIILTTCCCFGLRFVIFYVAIWRSRVINNDNDIQFTATFRYCCFIYIIY